MFDERHSLRSKRYIPCVQRMTLLVFEERHCFVRSLVGSLVRSFVRRSYVRSSFLRSFVVRSFVRSYVRSFVRSFVPFGGDRMNLVVKRGYMF